MELFNFSASKNAINIDEFSPADEVAKLVANSFDASILTSIDDSDIPRPKNILEWLTGKKFLNLGNTRSGKIGEGPYAKQVQVCLQAREQFCPHCTNPKLLIAPGILELPIDYSLADTFENVQTLEFGVCPKCKKTKLDFMHEGLFHAPNEAAACVGQRAGKSALDVMLNTNCLQEFLMIPNPQKYFGLLPGSPLVGTFTASSLGHADELLWQPFKAWYDASPWFKEYHKLLDYYGAKLGVELYYNKATYYFYANKNITGYCETPSIFGLRGPTRWFASIDEIGWFDADIQSAKTKLSAEGVYTALHNSLETLNDAANTLRSQGIPDPPQALMVNISSPSDVNDKIMRQVRASRSNRRIVAIHLATWEFNPRQSYDKLRKEHTNDLVFWRDFGAVPPWSSSPFFNDINQLEKLCDSKRPQNLLSYQVQYGNERKWLETTVHPQTPTHRLFTQDAGDMYNSYTGTISSYDKKAGQVVFEALFEAEPFDKEIDFEKMYDKTILPICKSGSIVQVVYDQWQSLHHIHALSNAGYKAEKYSLRWPDFELIQAALIAGYVRFPKLEVPIEKLKDSSEDLTIALRGKPVAKLLWQILTVRQVGNKVLKPQGEGSTDDLFRAVCLALAYWLNEKMRDDLLSRPLQGQIQVKGQGGCIGSYRGHGGGGAGSGLISSASGVFRPHR